MRQLPFNKTIKREKKFLFSKTTQKLKKKSKYKKKKTNTQKDEYTNLQFIIKKRKRQAVEPKKNLYKKYQT